MGGIQESLRLTGEVRQYPGLRGGRTGTRGHPSTDTKGLTLGERRGIFRLSDTHWNPFKGLEEHGVKGVDLFYPGGERSSSSRRVRGKRGTG